MAPGGTNWRTASIIKIEGLVFTPACRPFESRRQLTFFANGVPKIEVTHTHDPAKDQTFVYYWFKIDDAVVARAVDGALEIVLEVDPYAPEVSLGRGFWLFELWAV